MPYNGVRRNVFLSFYQGDRREADTSIYRWSVIEEVFTPKALGTFDNADFINSTNPEYVMNRIRRDYLGDSTVTIVLLGTCTHSRRYIDWEIKTSLRRGTYTPNGVMAILLPSAGGRAFLPLRFEANWNRLDQLYARYYDYPNSATQLGGWIEDAFVARTTRAHLIQNDAEMMKNNAACRVHGITH